MLRQGVPDIQDMIMSEAYRMRDDMVVCAVPEDLGGIGVGWLKVRIAIRGSLRVLSHSYYKIRMTDRCPMGYSCVDGQVRECAKGFFCPGDTINQVPRRCPIGWF